MRFVLDTNVVLSGLLWGGNPRLQLDAAKEEKIELVTSAPLLNELLNVLGRSKFDKKILAFEMTSGEVVAWYARLTTQVIPKIIPRTAVDPDDDWVLGTALAVRADCIVSGDKHLKSLGKFEDIAVISVAVAIRQCGLIF